MGDCVGMHMRVCIRVCESACKRACDVCASPYPTLSPCHELLYHNAVRDVCL